MGKDANSDNKSSENQTFDDFDDLDDLFTAIGSDIPNDSLGDDAFGENTDDHYWDFVTEPPSSLFGDDDPKGETQAIKEQNDLLSEDREKKIRELEAFASLHGFRRVVAAFIFLLILLWLGGMIYLVFLGSYEVFYFSGECSEFDFNSWYKKFKVISDSCTYLKKSTYLNLSESIIITLIGTTTANVLGLSYIVARWLFPSSETGSGGSSSK